MFYHGHASIHLDQCLSLTRFEETVIGRQWNATITLIIYCLGIQYEKDCLKVRQLLRMSMHSGYQTLLEVKERHIQATPTILSPMIVEINCILDGA